jgi:hypothetical protein
MDFLKIAYVKGEGWTGESDKGRGIVYGPEERA